MAEAKVKVGDKVNYVNPQTGLVRPALVLAINEEDVVTVEEISDEQPRFRGINAPYVSPAQLKKKLRGNTWHFANEAKS